MTDRTGLSVARPRVVVTFGGMGLLGKLFGGGEKVVPEHIETAEDFTSLVRGSDRPVLVYVWSETCQPCKKMADEVVATATKHRDRVRVAEINASKGDPRVLGTLGVRATPTVVVFDGGKQLGSVSGFRPRSWFDEMIATEFG